MAASRQTKRPDNFAKDGLENVAASLGNYKDKKAHTTYGIRYTNRVEQENAYRQSWLCKRIIKTIPDDMTRAWRTFDIGDDCGDKIKAISRLERRLQVRAKINEAMRWGRLYGGCLVLIGTADAANDEKVLATPLDAEKIKAGDLRYLQVIDRWRVAPSGTLVIDPTSNDFGLPESYVVTNTVDTATGASGVASGITYHHTRVLRFGGQPIPYFSWTANARWDDSELSAIWDAVVNKDTASSAIASLLLEAKVDVVKVPRLAELLSQKDGESKLLKRFQTASMLKSINNTLLLGEGEDYDQKQFTFAGLADVCNSFIDDVCGASQIPRQLLFGQSPKGLNATGDGEIRSYYDLIASMQESTLRPQLEKLDAVLIPSAIGAIPDDFDFEFNSLWQTDDKTQAEITKLVMERDTGYINAGVISEKVAAQTLLNSGTYSGMTEQDVSAAEDVINALPQLPETNTKGMNNEPNQTAER